jgi:hypothetical protein
LVNSYLAPSAPAEFDGDPFWLKCDSNAKMLRRVVVQMVKRLTYFELC